MLKTTTHQKRTRNPRTVSLDEGAGAAPVRRDDILSAARALFFARGFGATSMRDLAEHVGFTQAALYYHFKNKDAILFELIESFTVKLLSLLERALNETDDPLENLRRAVRAHILLSRDHAQDIKLVIEDKKLLSGSYADRVRETETGIYRLYKDQVELLIKAGVLRPVSSSVATFTLLAPINFIYQWRLPQGELPVEQIADQTLELLMNGFTLRGAATPSPGLRRHGPQ